MSKSNPPRFEQLALDLGFSNNRQGTDYLNLGKQLLNRLGLRTLKVSSSFMSNENIYLLLHQLAEYIGTQQSVTKERLIKSANAIAMVIPFPYEQSKVTLKASPCDLSQVTMFTRWHPEMIIKLSPSTSDRYTRYLVVTEDPIALQRANRVLCFNTKDERRNTRFVFLTPVLLSGLGILLADIRQQYHQLQQSLNFDLNRLNDSLEYVVNTKYCYSIYNINSKVISFLTDYLAKLYNISLQQSFNQRIATQMKAIHSERQMVQRLTVDDAHHQVRLLIDNNGSESVAADLQEALRNLWAILPHGLEQPTLRLRDLFNSRMAGLYDPQTNEIILDFPERRVVAALAKVGLRAFVHEYAHYLDYQFGKGQLSLQSDFIPVLKCYRADQEKEDAKQTAPTEVFARLFERYLITLHMHTVLLRDCEFYDQQSYQLSASGQKATIAYFDHTFPKLRENIATWNKQEMLVKQ